MDCPILLFAPNKDSAGGYLGDVETGGLVCYETKRHAPVSEYKIYTQTDSNWWHCLDFDIKPKIIKAIPKYLKERKTT